MMKRVSWLATGWKYAAIAASVVALTGCEALIDLGHVSDGTAFNGPPSALKGEIPVRVTNPPTPPGKNFTEAQPYDLCSFAFLTPDGGGKYDNWIRRTSPGSFEDFKIKPGHYRVVAKACMGKTTGWYAQAIGQVDIDLKGPTEFEIVAPGGEPRNGNAAGFTTQVVQTAAWKQYQTRYCADVHGEERCYE